MTTCSKNTTVYFDTPPPQHLTNEPNATPQLQNTISSYEQIVADQQNEIIFNDNKKLQTMLNNEAEKYATKINYIDSKDIFIVAHPIANGSVSNIHKGIIIPTLSEIIVKVIDKQYILKKKWTSNVVTEIIVLNKFRHKFIVKCYGIALTDTSIWIILENCYVGSIKYLFSQKFNEKLLKNIVFELILALGFLHTNHVMHRDIKEDNILLGNDGHLRLCDFNCSKIFTCQSPHTTSSYVGTPFYMPPDIKQGNYTYSIDWYELGIVIVRLILYDKHLCLYELHNIKFNDKEQLGAVFDAHKISVDGNLIDLITKLTDKNATYRLGTSKEILTHPWFASMDSNNMDVNSENNLFMLIK